MGDKFSGKLGSKKEYIVIQVCNLLGIAVGKLFFGCKTGENEDIELMTNMLKDYPFSGHYYSESNRRGSYEDFVKESYPNTIYLLKRAVGKGNLNKDKWMPLLKLFFNTVNEYMAESREEFQN